jgi:integrating conjugative element membrane protein (TIGR03747 family)
MAEPGVRVDHPVERKGFVGKSLDLIFKIIGLLVFSAIASILIEWIGMLFFYPGQGYEGYEHAQEMMQNEIGYMSSALDGDTMNSNAVRSASERVTVVVDTLFIDSGVIDALSSAKEVDPEDGPFLSVLKELVAECYNFLMAAVYILIMFMIRLSILILSIPVFILFGIVGISDGLMQRDLRRWCGGNESGYVYHWAKKFAAPILVASWVLYLSIPTSVHPNLIITPFAILFGLIIMVMASKFKKYV